MREEEPEDTRPIHTQTYLSPVWRLHKKICWDNSFKDKYGSLRAFVIFVTYFTKTFQTSIGLKSTSIQLKGTHTYYSAEKKITITSSWLRFFFLFSVLDY